MFDSLKDKLQDVFSALGKRGALRESDVDAALREVRLALLDAEKGNGHFVEPCCAEALKVHTLTVKRGNGLHFVSFMLPRSADGSHFNVEKR